MTAQHTPGPWHWESDEVKGDPTGRVRYQVVALGKTVTRVYYSSYEGGQTNAEADARLIAAAPDLLAVVIHARNVLPNEHWADDTRRMLDAAIARATHKEGA